MRKQKLKNIIAMGLVVAMSTGIVACNKTEAVDTNKGSVTENSNSKTDTETSKNDKENAKEEQPSVEVKPEQNVTSNINGQFCYYSLVTFDSVKTGTVTNVDSVLNVRVEPSLTATVVTKITNGTTVQVLAKAGDWYQVNVNGTVAFVHSNYVKVDGIEYKFTHDINERPYVTSKPSAGTISGKPTSSDDKKPSKPNNSKPSKPSNPSISDRPSIPVKPSEPSKPVKPSIPLTPIVPSIPVEPEKPGIENTAPIITGLDLVITGLNTEFKISDLNLKAMDKEDGDITSKIKVIDSNVDTSEAGEYYVTVSVTDSKGLETKLTLTVTVVEKEEDIPQTELNAVPTITGNDVTIKQNAIFSLDMLNIVAQDAEDGTLKFEVVSNNVNVAEAGKYQVKVTAKDKQGATCTKVFTVTVEAVETEKPVEPGVINGAPTITVDKESVTVIKGSKVDLSAFGVKAEDKEDGTLEVKCDSFPSTDSIGSFKFSVYAVDKEGAKTSKELTLVVAESQVDINEAPVLTVEHETVTVVKGDKVDLSAFGVKATDKENGDLEVKCDSFPSTDKAGTFKFAVYAVDKEGAKASKELTLIVKEKQEAINNAPVITVEKDTLSVKVGAKVSIADFGVKATDVENGDLEVKCDSFPSTETAGTYKFSVYAVDKDGAKTTKELTLEVVKDNTAPVLTANNVTINLGEAYDISMHNIKAVDSNGNDISDRVEVKTNCDGTRHGVFPVILTVTDDAGLTSTLTVTAFINSVPPTVTVQDVFEVQLYSSFNIYTDIPVTAVDVFGNAVTNIEFSGKVNTNEAGDYPVTITVTDKLYQKTVKTVTVRVVRPEGLMSPFSAEFSNIVSQEMDRLVNEYRVANNRDAVAVQSFAIECASLKAQHMVDNNYFDHTYNGQFIWDIYPEYREMGVCGENILKMNIFANKEYTAEEAKSLANDMFTYWKESPAHRAMMLSDWNTGYGFSFRVTNDGTVYAVQEWVVS